MSSLNWSKLVDQGRAKGFGIPWNAAELEALYLHKIPADYIRNGCLTPEDYAKAKGEHKENKPTAYKSKGELQSECKAKGLVFGPETTRAELAELLNKGVSQTPSSTVPPSVG